MKEVDYIVVGCGLAGILFCDLLVQNNRSFVAFDDGSQQSSRVAGGLYNPVVLKRFTPVWKSSEQLAMALPRYKRLEEQLKVKLDHKLPVYRLFASVEEQNNWFIASDKPGLSEFIRPEILQIENEAIISNHGFGEVLSTGRIDTGLLIDSFKEMLKTTGRLLEASFDYAKIVLNTDTISYKNIKAKHIIFADGFGLKQNPYFNHLPLKGTKGELLIISAPDLNIDFVLKSGAFLIPLGDHQYILGATYEWDDKSNMPTIKGKEELINKLGDFVSCNYEILDQVAGMRPTVADRRPLVGQHHDHKQMFVLNGLGTRVVMIAPYVSNELYEYIENNVPLDEEINISRFDN